MKKLIATAALLAVTAGAHAQNIVVDGGFESQTQAAGSWNVYSSLPGWNTVAGAGVEVRNQVAGNAFEGSNYIELDSYNNSAIAQTLATTAGGAYIVSFEYSARGGVSLASNPVQVFWNGTLLDTVSLDGSNQNGNVWHQYSYAVQALGKDVLKFAASGTSDGLGGSLDAVTVSAVPEPSTYALMAAGLVLVGFSRRRRAVR
jgi:PEP-CTERM motif